MAAAAGPGCADRGPEPRHLLARDNSRPGGSDTNSLLGSATTWPLKRYGRFLPPSDDDDDEEEQGGTSWKVFESNEESGHLIVTIVVSGHFFISQGRAVLVNSKTLNLKLVMSQANPGDMWDMRRCITNLAKHYRTVAYGGTLSRNLISSYRKLYHRGLEFTETYASALVVPGDSLGCMEGFSLIDSHKWLQIVRRADCLLFGAKSKNECRMFRVQFGGDSKEQMLEHCSSCVQKLAEYVPVQVTDEQSQMLYQDLNQLAHSENQVKNYEQNVSILHTTDEPLTDSYTSFGERRSITQLAQSVLKSKSELPLVYRHSVWSAQELGPFIRLCLMDQNFPAFVEDVEKELKKLTEG